MSDYPILLTYGERRPAFTEPIDYRYLGIESGDALQAELQNALWYRTRHPGEYAQEWSLKAALDLLAALGVEVDQD